jgi:hypothetical protein
MIGEILKNKHYLINNQVGLIKHILTVSLVVTGLFNYSTNMDRVSVGQSNRQMIFYSW